MNEERPVQQRFFAAVAAAAVSAMCVLGTVGPVQAGDSSPQVQLAETASEHGVA